MGPKAEHVTSGLGYDVELDPQGNITRLTPVYFDKVQGDRRGESWDQRSLDYINKDGGVPHLIRVFDFDMLIIHVPGNSEPKEQTAMTLTPRQSIIVSLLQSFSTEPLSVGTIVAHTAAPAASIRRNIASLRNKGFNIDATGHGYTLVGVLEGTVVEVETPFGGAVAQLPQSAADDARDEYAKPEYHDTDLGDVDDDYDPFEEDFYGEDDLEDDPFEGLDD